MAQIKVKRKTGSPVFGTDQLQEGEIGLVGSYFGWGSNSGGSNLVETVFAACQNRDNTFIQDNIFKVPGDGIFQIQNMAGDLTKTYFANSDGFLRTNIENENLTGTMLVNANYVDARLQGLNIKQSVRLATTININLAKTDSLDIDGESVADGDRILVKNQSDAEYNGIYVFLTGTGCARAGDASSDTELKSAFVFVEEGTWNGDTGWVCTSDNIVLNSSSIVWTQFSGAGSYEAGTLLDRTGVTFNVDLSEAADMTGDVVGSEDELILLDNGNQRRKQINEIKLGQFNNDQNWTSNVGTVTSVTGTSPIVSSGGTTPVISLANNYGDTKNPYASKTSKYFLAAPNASAGVPSFRTIVASDIPILNQNTTGTAANITGTVPVTHGGTNKTSIAAQSILATTSANSFTVVSATSTTKQILLHSTTDEFSWITLSAVNLSEFNNDSGLTSNVGNITDVTAGNGLSGGGSSGSITLALDFSELVDMTGDIASTTEFIIQNGSTASRKAASEIKLSNFNNNSGWTSNTGTVTSVSAGTGMNFTTFTTTGTITLRSIVAGNSVVGALKYNSTNKFAGSFYGGSDNPDNSNRLNYDGYFYATKLEGIIDGGDWS